MEIIEKVKSADKMAVKLLQKSKDGYLCETVVVDYYNKNIICFSCALGCPVGCKMCYNGVYKNFIRNLNADEIVAQIKNAMAFIDPKKVTLFSAMGVGEPLLNYENVAKAFIALNTEFSGNKFAMATTLPSSKNLEEFLSMIRDVEKFKIMISLHAPTTALRYKIIPIKTAVKKLVNDSIKISKKFNRECEFNYLLFDKFNDSKEHAVKLAKLIPDEYVIKINHFNHVQGVELKPSTNYDGFISTLKQLNKKVEEYSTNGEDIGAACGQLCSNKKLD